MSTNGYTKKEGQAVLVSSLRFLPYNPESRTAESGALQILREAIREKGVQYPLAVNAETNQVIDGHRRTTIARELGIEKLPATLYYGLSKNQMKELYFMLNGPGTKQAHTNRQWLEIIHRGGPGTPSQIRLYNTLKRILSSDELDEYIGRGVGMYATARAWSRRLGMENDKFMRHCIVWMMQTGSWRDAIDAYRNRPRITNRKFLSAMEKGCRLFPKAEKKVDG